MPKILNYTPGWLSRPSPGFQVFNTAQSSPSSIPEERNVSVQYRGDVTNGSEYVGPNRTIAQRDTEVFLVAGKQIRWTDLVSLKDGLDEQLQSPSRRPKAVVDSGQSNGGDDGPDDGSYRVLKVPISERIRQLSISPNGNFLAIATSHTVHIAILPDSSLLGQLPNKPIKLKTYTVGPTAHVLSQAQVTNVLWHPYGVDGNCLITITVDAILRMWEFNRENRWSFDNPSLAIDLKKLVVGSSEAENFAPDQFGKNRRFSIDNVGLEVASACFGGIGSDHESGWSAMTLWIAMKGGDVYALCPLLPSKWQPSATLIPSISAAAVAREASKTREDSPLSDSEQQWRDQLDWIRDIDSQDATSLEAKSGDPAEIYSRPSHAGPIPRLQGPFQIFGEDTEEDLELSDIHVIASRLDPEEFMDEDDSGSEADSTDEDGLSASIILLMTRIGRVFLCLDLEGVEGQWLPRKKPKRLSSPPEDPYLVALEGLDTLTPTEQLDLHWPMFSHDICSRYSIFTTHNNGLFYFSFDPWVRNLEKELQDSEKLGAQLRLEFIKDGPGTLRERIMSFDEERDPAFDHSVPACLTFLDSDIGYFILTSVDGYPQCANFDVPMTYDQREPTFIDEQDEALMPEMDLLSLGPARAAYQIPEAFNAPSSFPRFLDQRVHSRHKKMVKEPVRLSTATLDLMTHAHRMLSQETHRLGLAASDLFRRCERLQDELKDQIRRTKELAERTNTVIGEDADPYLEHIKSRDPPTLEQRLSAVRSTQGKLASRYEDLRKKFGTFGGKTLSEKESHWVSEVTKAHKLIKAPPEDHEEEEELASGLWHRCREVEDLKEDLIKRTREVSQDQQTNDDTDTIPDDLRRQKITQVKRLLEVQTGMVETAKSRLQRLGDTTNSY